MRPRRVLTGLAVLLLGWGRVVGGAPTPAPVAPLVVSPRGPYLSPLEALAAAGAGDTIAVYGGSYAGPLVVSKPVTLLGYDWPILDGGQQGTVVKLAAPGIVLKGFVIRNSGTSLDAENAGIAVEAPAAVIEQNRLEETLFGIYLRQAPGSRIRGNVIRGKALALPRRGDAIRVWYSNGVAIEANDATASRDVVLWYSQNLLVRDNVFTGGRYGLHFMYCDDAVVEGNRLTANSVGAFLMYSRRLQLRRNTIAFNRGASGYGVGLKDMDDAVLAENLLLENQVGVLVDNSPRAMDSTTLVEGNVFAFNDIGITMLPAVQRNRVVGNSFIDNDVQVSVAGGGQLRGNQWTRNYWSDYVGYDGDGDGIGDVPYLAERLFENLMDRHAALRLFVYSPVTQAVDFAARAFPVIKPRPKLSDATPRMVPRLPPGLPPLPAPARRSVGITAGALLVLAALVVLFPHLPLARRAALPTNSRAGGTRMVHVRELRKRFGALLAVDDLSFSLPAGVAMALWGANGAGKTTILRCLLGLLPYEGMILVAGHDVRRDGKAARRSMGFVPQELSFHDDLTVQETMRFYGRLKHAASAPRIADLLKRLGLAAQSRKQVRELSGGMKQRLALAIALLAEPPLLLLDEPTANLDAGSREAFLRLLAEVKAAGTTILFSSHRLEEVMGLADRVLVLEQGRLVSDCSPDALRQSMAAKASRQGGRREGITRLRLHVPGEWLEPAVAALSAHGFANSRNGRHLSVQVPSQAKGGAISILVQAGIPVLDFDIDQTSEES